MTAFLKYPASKPNSFITGLISLAVTNKANSIGAPWYVVYALAYLAAQACVSMRTWDVHYISFFEYSKVEHTHLEKSVQ